MEEVIPATDPLVWLPLLVIVLTVLWFLKMIKRRGDLVKQTIDVSISMYLNKSRYTLLRNIAVPDNDGTPLIQYLIVSPFGLFLICPQSPGGTITGARDAASWTRTSHSQSGAFQNPLSAASAQAQALAAVLGIQASSVFALVVFVGEGHFGTPMPAEVSFGKGFIEYIHARTTPLLSAQQIRDTLDTLAALQNPRSAR